MNKLKAAMTRWRQRGRRFFVRETPKDIWELNKQTRQMETRATITIAIAVSILLLSITICLLPQLLRLWK